jgi:DNA replication initiation complex subunit (GINS family)
MSDLNENINSSEDDIENLDLDSNAEKLVEADGTVTVEIDRDGLKRHVFKTLNLQDVAEDVVGINPDFYDDLRDYLCMVDDVRSTRSLTQNIDSFVDLRIDYIIMHSLTFSNHVYDKLSKEEAELYKRMCNEVSCFRQSLMDKVKEKKGI